MTRLSRFLREMIFPMLCVANGLTQAQSVVNDTVQQSRALLQQGKGERAVASLEPYVAAHPDSDSATYLLAYAYCLTHQPKLSLQLYTRGAALRPPTADDLMGVSADYISLGDYTDASKWLRQVTSMQPQNALAWYYLGRSLHLEGLYSEALKSFERAQETKSQYVRAKVAVGLTLEALGNESAALEAYNTAITWEQSLHEQDAQPYLAAGELLLKQGKTAASIERFSEAAKRSHGNPRVSEDLGKAYERLNRYAEAQTALEDGERLDPSSSTIHYLLGTAYQRQGLKDQATREFELAHSLLNTESNHDAMNFDLTPSPEPAN